MFLHRVKISKQGTTANNKTHFVIGDVELSVVGDQRV